MTAKLAIIWMSMTASLVGRTDSVIRRPFERSAADPDRAGGAVAAPGEPEADAVPHAGRGRGGDLDDPPAGAARPAEVADQGHGGAVGEGGGRRRREVPPGPVAGPLQPEVGGHDRPLLGRLVVEVHPEARTAVAPAGGDEGLREPVVARCARRGRPRRRDDPEGEPHRPDRGGEPPTGCRPSPVTCAHRGHPPRIEDRPPVGAAPSPCSTPPAPTRSTTTQGAARRGRRVKGVRIFRAYWCPMRGSGTSSTGRLRAATISVLTGALTVGLLATGAGPASAAPPVCGPTKTVDRYIGDQYVPYTIAVCIVTPGDDS